MYTFFDKHDLGSPYNHIHPYKQEQVFNLIKDIPDCVELVIIFGSSVTFACRQESDLDICVISKEECNLNYCRPKFTSMDVLRYATLEDLVSYAKDINSVAYDIINEGVLVYEKDSVGSSVERL